MIKMCVNVLFTFVLSSIEFQHELVDLFLLDDAELLFRHTRMTGVKHTEPFIRFMWDFITYVKCKLNTVRFKCL